VPRASHAAPALPRPPHRRGVLPAHGPRPLPPGPPPGRPLTGARLAYLSACGTRAQGKALADESVHIVSAFQIAGYAGVVGSLWRVDDAVSARLAAAVYTELRGPDGRLDADRAPAALHRSVRELRRRYAKAPSLWAGYVHAGV
ncbi:CHAT domain-containing protein, partial [Spirillospora sp. NPDC050679]